MKHDVDEVPLSVAQVDDTEQSFMQAVYDGLFCFLVDRLSGIICHDTLMDFPINLSMFYSGLALSTTVYPWVSVFDEPWGNR